MDEERFRRVGEPQENQAKQKAGEEMAFLLKTEEILQSISARAPLPEVLNRICSALDWDLGNAVSLISLPGGGAGNLASNAQHFGLYTFCTAGIFLSNGELVGSLEVYCCVPRNPSPREIQLLERATCLAAIAIQRTNEAQGEGTCGMLGNRWVRERLFDWPFSMN